MKFNTKAIHGGQQHDPSTGAVMTPIYQTSTFAQRSPGDYKGYEYSRGANPTRTALENALASIEGGVAGFAFGSGLAAIDGVLKLFKPQVMKSSRWTIYTEVLTVCLHVFMKNLV